MSIARKILMGAAGGKADPIYMEDVFSTYLYKGTGSTRSINNGVDLSGEGGLVWFKPRNQAWNHALIDSVTGISKFLQCPPTSGTVNQTTALTSFNNNGVTLGADSNYSITNNSSTDYVSWTYRKAPGFFDVVNYTGNGATSRAIAHSLGSVPGMIIIKNLSNSADWAVYHRGITASKYLSLNKTDNANNGGEWFADGTEPTASVFSVGNQVRVNANGDNYVAYIFAGGESTAAAARSVEFDGSNDYLSIPDNADWHLGTSSFTIEGWVYPDKGSMTGGYYGMICGQTSANWYVAIRGGSGLNSMQYYDGVSAHNSAANSIPEGQWTHVAFVNNSGTGTWYINGTLSKTSDAVSAPNIPNSSGAFEIGRNNNGSYFNGKISNLRVVKGTAVYTSGFRPPTEPLTNITNTKLLCCNNSSVTGATISPGTITNSGSTASIDSPFDDPEGYKFGEEGDQNIIKCGTYVGNGQAEWAGPFTHLGWEPQFLLIKNTSSAASWAMFDRMRGIRTNGKTQTLSANQNNAEGDYTNFATVTSSGFHAGYNDVYTNSNGDNYIYMAIRSSDGHVGKPVEAGTDSFAMDTGNSSGTIPTFDSGFPVEFGLVKYVASTGDWYAEARLVGDKYLKTNVDGNGTSSDTSACWDSNVGWAKAWNSSHQSWMWKIGAGFDVAAYEGNGIAGRQIPHNLAKPPEMVWVKVRDETWPWKVYHKGYNGGVNPENYWTHLNENYAENNSGSTWNDTAPSATHMTLGSDYHVNAAVNFPNSGSRDYLMMLFTSVEGISKVGYYTGTGAAGNTQTTGFTPRFIIVKCVTDTVDWGVFDTLRGLGSSGNDGRLYLNTNQAQVSSHDYLTTSATGFTPAFVGSSVVNASGQKFIYYAHA